MVEFKNPLRRAVLVSCVVVLAGLIMIVLPFAIGMDGFHGGFALAAGGVFVTIAGIVAVAVYAVLSRRLANTLTKENILAHWTYSALQWQEYTEQEHKTDWRERKGLFLVIAAITVIVGAVFGLITGDALFAIFFVLGLICFVGIVAWLTATANYLRNKRGSGEIYIARDGAYFNGQFHYWGGLGSHMKSAEYVEIPEPLITITYSAVARNGANSYNVRIPVPPGEENAASKIVARINEAHR